MNTVVEIIKKVYEKDKAELNKLGKSLFIQAKKSKHKQTFDNVSKGMNQGITKLKGMFSRLREAAELLKDKKEK